ncbi:hypothetical protein FisN_30Lu021 [Fistulifera solaris]|uniref:PITH domain-containing protein n=1 Tax=Fistulifera solaris TaxID=1519565 RepID=A0A1Z5JI91_FISSO|nr:hypothetical protein FisN_30Lu021 [Fistulifera solaris]|eukprot:GAX13733.1 hypothetical protein FisN_30Lu021 [Fistulifera solaris]
MAELFPQAAAAATTTTTNNEPTDDGKVVNLNAKICMAECYARNESKSFPMSNLFIGDSRLGCKSDADEQLILHIAFDEFVKVKEIKLTEFNQGLEPENNPSKIHIFVNRDNLGFEDCDDVDPTQTLHLTTEQLKEHAAPIPLQFVKYQRVKSMTLFIEDNQGGDVTALGGLKFYGRPVVSTNMSEFKKNPQE